MNYKKKTGARGEELAAEYLVSEGYTITARNLHVSHDEIDIIAENEGLYCIRGGEDPRADQSEQTLWTTSRRGELHQEPEADKVSRGISP